MVTHVDHGIGGGRTSFEIVVMVAANSAHTKYYLHTPTGEFSETEEFE